MQTTKDNFFNNYLLFLGIIFVWGFSWPITKVGLDFMPPYWFVVCRSSIGCAIIFAILKFQNRLILPKKEDIPIIFSVGLVEIGIALPMVTYGMSFIETARSALLLYTTPLWAAPLAYFLYKEKINSAKLIGLLLGFFGLLILFKPTTFDWHDKNVVTGNGYIILAAVLWAMVLVHTRYGKWVSPPLVLLPWQLLLGSMAAVLWAQTFEYHPIIQWNTALVLSILFNAIFACAFGFFASITVARRLPVMTTTLGYLGVPIVGIVSSAIVFHDHLTLNFLFASVFILSGLVVVALSPNLRLHQSVQA